MTSSFGSASSHVLSLSQHQWIPTDLPGSLDANKQQRQLIAELECKNRSDRFGEAFHSLPVCLLSSRFYDINLENKRYPQGSYGHGKPGKVMEF